MRVLQATPANISETWYSGTTVTDPGTVTVTVTRDDGTIITPPAVTGTGATPRSITLTTAHTALLDRLTIVWTSATAGTLTSRVEIVGGFFFSLAEFAAISLGGTKTIGTTYSEAAMREMRTTVEDAIEHACGIAFVPRYARHTASAWGYPIRLKPYLRAIRSVSVSGVAYTAPQIAAIAFTEAGFVYGTGISPYYPTGAGLVIGYEHGMDDPRPRVKAAALLLARTWIVKGPVDDRVTTMSSPDTGITAALAVPGRGGSIVGVPEVDAVINEYRMVSVA